MLVKNFNRLALRFSLLASAACALPSAPALAQSASGTAGVTLMGTPMTIEHLQDMALGTFSIPSDSIKVVSVDCGSGGAVVTTDTTATFISGPQRCGQITIHAGGTARNFTLRFDRSGTTHFATLGLVHKLFDNNGLRLISIQTSDTSGTETDSQTLAANASASYYIGGSVDILTTNQPGEYTASYEVVATVQ